MRYVYINLPRPDALYQLLENQLWHWLSMMLYQNIAACLLTLASPVTSIFLSHHGGSGPFPAVRKFFHTYLPILPLPRSKTKSSKQTWFTDPTLPRHTIYSPSPPLPDTLTLPVLVFAEGGCDNNGTKFEPFLTNIASYGFIVLALGPPNGTGKIFQDAMDEAVSWIQRRGGKQGRYEKVDSSRIAAAGQSCGGLLAYTQRSNDAVGFLGIFNSGLLGNTTDSQENLPDGVIIEEPGVIKEVQKPVFYYIGGQGDVAYPAVSGPMDFWKHDAVTR